VSGFLASTRPINLSQSDWSPFEGWSLTGWPAVTIVNGNIVYQKGEFFAAIPGKALEFNN
jgi:dihydroorotase